MKKCYSWSLLFGVCAVTLLFCNPLRTSAQENRNPEQNAQRQSENEQIEGETGESISKKADFLGGEVIFGGSFISSFRSEWGWDGYFPAPHQFFYPDSSAFLIDLGADLALDARPSESFRTYGEVELRYPFNLEENFPDNPRFYTDNIRIMELFAQFDWKKILFFQAGKTLIDWGTGYYFSASDVVNPTPINPLSPTEEREGPISAMIMGPVGPLAFYLFVIAEEVTEPEELGMAPKITLELGPVTSEAGFYYQQTDGLGPTLSAEVKLGLFTLFADGSLIYNTHKRFIGDSDDASVWPKSLEVVTKEDQWFFRGSTGVLFNHSEWQLFSALQYFYNGLGYTDQEILKNDGVELLLVQERISEEELHLPGKHYFAGEVEWEIFNTGLTLGAFGIINFSQWSGKLVPALSWSPFSFLEIGIDFPMDFGDPEEEFSANGTALNFGFHLTFGEEDF